MRKHRFNNSYLISAISVSLVLCLIGMECVLLLSAGALVTRMRENITITAVLSSDADTTRCGRLEMILDHSDWCSGYTYISAEEALEEHIRSLGEDPSTFLGFNPLRASYEIHPTDVYSEADSLAVIAYRVGIAVGLDGADCQYHPPADIRQALYHQHDDTRGCHFVGDPTFVRVEKYANGSAGRSGSLGSHERTGVLHRVFLGLDAVPAHVAKHRHGVCRGALFRSADHALCVPDCYRQVYPHG